MPISKVVMILLTLVCNEASAKKLDLGEFRWAQELKGKVQSINVCGDGNIQVSQKSLRKNFLIGAPAKGYLLSELLQYQEYKDILTKQNFEPSKSALREHFSKTVLWEVSEDGNLISLGSPSLIELKYTASIKDCLEGKERTLGGTCKRDDLAQKTQCCSEKFVGPLAHWRTEKGDITLMYSPDPSVRLKVPGEKKHRFCNVMDSVAL